MSNTLVLHLPKCETWNTEQFLRESLLCSEAGATFLSSCSEKVEDAVKEVLELLRSTALLPQINDFDSDEIAKSKKDELELFENECEDLFMHFQHRNLEALVSSVRCTLDCLRRRITTTSASSTRSPVVGYHPKTTYVDDCSHSPSCFQADLILAIPNVVMQPSLEDVQNAVNQVVMYVCEVGRHIRQWSPPHSVSINSHHSKDSSKILSYCIPYVHVIH